MRIDELPQTGTSITCEEAKMLIDLSYENKWEKEHPHHQRNDVYCQLNREERVIILRLRTRQNRLSYDIYDKFKTGSSD